MEKLGQVDVVVGLQRGDEGKGRVTDNLAQSGDYAIVGRGRGGANAGHTVFINGVGKLGLHQIPSGIACPGVLNIIGAGTFIDPRRLQTEITDLKNKGVEISEKSLRISHAAQLVLPHCVHLDEVRENGAKAQGSTKTGIAFTASDKYLRNGYRVEVADSYDANELFEIAASSLAEAAENGGQSLSDQQIIEQARGFTASVQALKPFIDDTNSIVVDSLRNGQSVLAEGSQGYWLDIDHGMYPAVTSASTTVGGILDGLGIAPGYIGRVYGAAKLIKSHVGSGPFVTEIFESDLAERLRGKPGEIDSEYGTTTNRQRRVGYFDLVELSNAVTGNGIDNNRNGQPGGELFLTKADHASRFGRSMLVAIAYELGGKKLSRAPASAAQLDNCQPIYEEFPTWGNIKGINRFEDLPFEAQNFIKFVEESLDAPVSQVGTGPEREDMISKAA